MFEKTMWLWQFLIYCSNRSYPHKELIPSKLGWDFYIIHWFYCQISTPMFFMTIITHFLGNYSVPKDCKLYFCLHIFFLQIFFQRGCHIYQWLEHPCMYGNTCIFMPCVFLLFFITYTGYPKKKQNGGFSVPCELKVLYFLHHHVSFVATDQWASPKHLMEGFSRHNPSLIGRKNQAKFENDCISRSGHRFKIPQPNLMILVLFSFAEDALSNDVTKYEIFSSQGTENPPFRFFWDTRYKQYVYNDALMKWYDRAHPIFLQGHPFWKW